MPDETLRGKLYNLYAAYAEGRINDALISFDDEVTMTSHAPVDVFPYLGRQQGKMAIRRNDARGACRILNISVTRRSSW